MINMKQRNKKTKVAPDEEELTTDDEEERPVAAPLDALSEVAKDAVIGPALLSQLSTALLYKLLQQKKVPGRTKIRKVEARAKALAGMVTVGDLKALGIDVPEDATMPRHTSKIHVDIPDFIKEHHEMYEKYKPGTGKRIDEPVGSIDVHEATLVYAIANPKGIVAADTVGNEHNGMQHLAQVFREHGVTCVAMESTAEYWLKIYWLLHAEGIHVLVANPKQTKETQGQKTDLRDAKRIAIAFRDGRLKPSVLCTPEQFQLRKLSRDMTERKQQATQEINALKVMCHMFDASEWIRKLNTSARGCRILSIAPELASNEEMLSLLSKEFARGRGMIEDGTVLNAMAKEMREFFRRLSLVPGAIVRFQQHFDQYLHFRTMASDLLYQILQIVEKDKVFMRNLELLLTCPSVDVDSAIPFLIEIVDVRFFWHPGALVRWVGLGPRVKQSGFNKRNNGHIYKGGNKGARRTLWLAAKVDHAHCKKGGHPVGEFVAHLRSKNKPYKVSVTAGARKLTTVIYHVLTMQKPFQEVYAHLDDEKQARNRERKKQALLKLMKAVPVVDVLESLSKVLPRRCVRFLETEEKVARKIHAMLGARLEFAAIG
jgi:transposase